MGIQTNSNYFSSIRTHLSRKRMESPGAYSSNSANEQDERNLQLRPASSHNENVQECVVQSPQWVQMSPLPLADAASLANSLVSSSAVGNSSSQQGDLPKLTVINAKCFKNLPRYTYPNGTSSLIRRGTFKGFVDRRPSNCVFASSGTLSHCTFKSCYCMRVPIIPSPLRHCATDEELEVNDENENVTTCEEETADPSGFERIRHASWMKLKNLIDPTTADTRETWASFDDFNAELNNSKEIAGPVTQRLKRSFIHGNLKRIVGHRSTMDLSTGIPTKSHSSPSSASGLHHQSVQASSPGVVRSLSNGHSRSRHGVRSVSSPV